jgi:tRNA G10  N-methylase Trm11
MNRYFATFISGTQEIVLRQLKKLPLDHLKVKYIDDGLIVFDASFSPERIIDFRFFNNTFLLLHDFGEQTDVDIEGLAAQLNGLKLRSSQIVTRLVRNKMSRLVVVEENRPVAISTAGAVEDHLNKVYELKGGGSAHFWLVRRRCGKGLFGLRLARPPFKRGKRPAGMLRAELAHMLCLVAGLSSKDKILDPFAGHGSIVKESIEGFNAASVIAVETEARHVKKLLPI